MASSATGSDAEVNTMQIFVKNVQGSTIPLTLPTNTPISTLQQILHLRTPDSSIPASDLRLVHAGKHLSSPSGTLSSYNIPRESVIHVALPLRGGMPPKKIRCSFKQCKDAAQRIVGDCGFCDGHFCGKHRLLEDHMCNGLEDCKKESHERNKERLEAERTVAIRGV